MTRDVNYEITVTPEQEALRELVREFAHLEIAPYAQSWDRDAVFPLAVVQRMGELGLFGIPFSERYGGGGGDLTSVCIAIEELARVDPSMAVTLECQVGVAATMIDRFGTREQKEKWLPDLLSGRALAAFALTESGGGSDAGATRTTARLDEQSDEWVINGEKTFITNSGTPITSIITVMARTGPEELSAIVVPADSPGIEVGPAYHKMGWRASDTHGLRFTECRVPVDCLLGARGRGLAQFLTTLDDGRVAIAALAVGMIQECLEQCVTYAKTRHAFGKPIGAQQAVAFKCADMAVMARCARDLTYGAGWLRDNGRPCTREAAMAKLYASESAVTATRLATQVFGGYGFIDETLVSRFYRDAKILEIGEGTSEIQRLIICRSLGLPVG